MTIVASFPTLILSAPPAADGAPSVRSWLFARLGVPANSITSIAFDLLVIATAFVGIASVAAIIGIWAERKVSAHIHSRIGPNRVGPIGLLQSIADGVKLILK